MSPTVSEVFDGRYRIDERLGTGGFATVYGAVDVGTGLEVALKIFRPDQHRGTYEHVTVARFEREAALLRQLRSPHTVRVLGSGANADGLLYLVFERLRGEDLADVLARVGRLDAATTVEVLVQVLDALAEAHGLGLVHRDLKPENIYWIAGAAPRVKLLDFGIAHTIDPATTRLTRSGEIVGTLRYMSPEQLAEKPLSAASDIYSLGMIGIELLLGRDSLQTTQLFARLQSGTARTLPELEQFGALSAVLQKMTARRPRDRFPSAVAAQRALRHPEAFARPSPRARPRTPSERSSRRARNLILLGTAAAVAFAGLAGFALFNRPEPPPPVAPRVLPTKTGEALLARPAPARSEAGALGAAPAARESADPSSGCGREPAFRGRHDMETDDGLSLQQFLAYVPRSYDPAKPAPLVIMLHQTGEGPELLVPSSGFEKLAEKKGFIVIAPYGRLDWPWSDNDRDIRSVRLAIDETARAFCVDRTRVFVVGHGHGGHFAHRLSCERWVTAIATNSFRAGPEDKFCPTQPPKPHIMSSPLRSDREPVDGGPSCGGKVVHSLQAVEQQWRTRNECKGEARSTFRRGDSECFTWSCATPFTSCHLDGGHPWPGTPPRSFWQEHCDGTPPDFPLAAQIWEFFRAVDPLEDPK